jgi:hypothetical protein
VVLSTCEGRRDGGELAYHFGMVVDWDGAGPGKVGRAGIREGNQAYGLVVRFG